MIRVKTYLTFNILDVAEYKLLPPQFFAVDEGLSFDLAIIIVLRGLRSSQAKGFGCGWVLLIRQIVLCIY